MARPPAVRPGGRACRSPAVLAIAVDLDKWVGGLMAVDGGADWCMNGSGVKVESTYFAAISNASEPDDLQAALWHASTLSLLGGPPTSYPDVELDSIAQSVDSSSWLTSGKNVGKTTQGYPSSGCGPHTSVATDDGLPTAASLVTPPVVAGHPERSPPLRRLQGGVR